MLTQELNETRKQLKESLSLYENLYEHAPVGYFSIDEKGRIFKINMAGCVMRRKLHDPLSGLLALEPSTNIIRDIV